MKYWDTSVLLKLFVEEDDSRAFAALMAEATEGVHTSELSRLELLRALWGKRLDGAIPAGAEELLMRRFEREVATRRIILVPLRNDVREEFEAVLRICYARPRPIRLRALDALHLASARACKTKEIVCTDRRMREAAVALGMEIHPQKSN
jgi:uncharacterized protein